MTSDQSLEGDTKVCTQPMDLCQPIPKALGASKIGNDPSIGSASKVVILAKRQGLDANCLKANLEGQVRDLSSVSRPALGVAGGLSTVNGKSSQVVDNAKRQCLDANYLKESLAKKR